MHVTVLMSVYNGARYLERAVRSIEAQTCQDWDLLIVDDGSQDDTPAILDKLCARNSKISVLRNSSNLGLGSSLNRGWRQARGELIARMDADDISLPERLELQRQFMEGHSDVDVLGCGAHLRNDMGDSLGTALRPEHHADLVSGMYKETPFFHAAVIIRKRFLCALGGYDESLRFGQDTDLWLRGYTRFRYHNLQLPLIEYTQRAGLSWGRAWASIYIILKAAYRENLLVTKGWYALYYAVAFLAIKIGIRGAGVRTA